MSKIIHYIAFIESGWIEKLILISFFLILLSALIFCILFQCELKNKAERTLSILATLFLGISVLSMVFALALVIPYQSRSGERALSDMSSQNPLIAGTASWSFSKFEIDERQKEWIYYTRTESKEYEKGNSDRESVFTTSKIPFQEFKVTLNMKNKGNFQFEIEPLNNKAMIVHAAQVQLKSLLSEDNDSLDINSITDNEVGLITGTTDKKKSVVISYDLDKVAVNVEIR